MSIRLYADELRCAIYEEAPGGGDPLDPASMMNRPVVSPLSWLDNIYFHSDLAYYGIAASDLSKVVSHGSVPGRSVPVTPAVTVIGNVVKTSHNLITHNLGYVPKFFCIYNGRFIPQGTAVQSLPDGRRRYVCAYATATEIRLFETAYTTQDPLPATNLTYQILVFRDAAPDPGAMMLDIYPGEAVFGQGKFRASQPHLRADGSGDIPWPLPTSRTADVRNGGLIVWQPNGGSSTDGPYNGSFGPPSFINSSAGV